jgi:hypothetical protein
MPEIPYGAPLTAADISGLARCGISEATVRSACLRRVTSFDGAEMMGRNGSGDFNGIIFPYFDPVSGVVRNYRLRRDNPEIESGKPKNKYIAAPGSRNMLYCHPVMDPDWITDTSLQILLTEGEKKTLALYELAWHHRADSAMPEWLPLGISGVQNWKGTIGKVEGPDYPGQRLDEKGVVADFDRIEWKGRRVVLVFDSNVHTNEQVRIARFSLAKELRSHGATVLFVDIPADAGVNGIDDLIGLWGPDRVLDLLRNPYDPKRKKQEQAPSKIDIDSIPTVRSFDSHGVGFIIEGLIGAGCVNMVTGESGHGKSTLATAMGNAISESRDLG